ncbi:MAG: multicopper oxidase domain-containing protein [Terracidiphilus sp.]|jgi:FtsP/CotA-like multicopper oxidase with cupredoxin domain
MKRREFLASAGALIVSPALNSALVRPFSMVNPGIQAASGKPNPASSSISKPPATAADYALKIEPCSLEISPGVSIETIAYNGQVPGPILRLREGSPVTIDVFNASKNAEIVHWHGLQIDSLNDGAMEEGSPMIPSGGSLRYHFAPRPAGTRWYHTHTTAGADLSKATYTGQFGFLLVDGGNDPGHYDQETFLAIHHWGPSFVPMVETMQMQSANHPASSGSDVGYQYATINQHRLGYGEPIRVKQGQKVMMHLLNASATENVLLALPGHKFRVVAMDGNPVPNQKEVEILSLAVAERVDAIVEMNAPGVWILGSTLEKSRQMGLGVVIEYSGKTGAPVWHDPSPADWDYTQFAGGSPAPKPDETVNLVIVDLGAADGSKFDTWAVNGKSWPDTDPITVERGKRYRLVFQNASADQHPMHLHRHTFEVTSIGDKNLSGLKKDVVNVMPLDTVAVDFVADNPGDTLLHCHMQLHMDYGFMQLIRYAG